MEGGIHSLLNLTGKKDEKGCNSCIKPMNTLFMDTSIACQEQFIMYLWLKQFVQVQQTVNKWFSTRKFLCELIVLLCPRI